MQETLRTGLVALAPVASITNSIFRRICKTQGADYAVTELVSSEALTRESLHSYELARFTPAERPIAVQIFGGDPEKMGLAAELVCDMQPNAIDINMGCPARKVVRHAGGSDLLRDLPRLGRVVAAVVRRSNVPVSVKIRAGWDEASLTAVDAARVIEAEGGQWVTVHPRTRAQGFGGKARWEIIRAVKEAVAIPVIGNGDIFAADDALRMFAATGCDSVMVGRGSFGYPWIFAQIKARLAGQTPHVPTPRERVDMALLNLRMEMEECDGDVLHTVRAMRKHLAWYVADLPGTKEIRTRIFAADSYDEVEGILREFAESATAVLATAAASAGGTSAGGAGTNAGSASVASHAAAGRATNSTLAPENAAAVSAARREAFAALSCDPASLESATPCETPDGETPVGGATHA